MKLASRSPECFRINCPDLFARPDFQVWLNRWAGRGLATWHSHEEGPPGDYSDVFILFDHGEGPESPTSGCEEYGAMPEECWDLLTKFCKEEGIGYALLWLMNLE